MWGEENQWSVRQNTAAEVWRAEMGLIVYADAAASGPYRLSFFLAPDMDPTMPPDISGHEITTKDQTQQQHFGATWNSTDSAHLLPTLPVKHVPRAWERKPQSPAVKQRFTRKIWRRHDFPNNRPATNPDRHGTKPLNDARIARIKNLLAASPSPRKIVKKRCIHTSFGQSATANHWDQKSSTPLRRLPRPFATTPTDSHPTGKQVQSRLFASPSPFKRIAQLNNASRYNATANLPAPEQHIKQAEQEEWSDFDSSEEQVVQAEQEGQAEMAAIDQHVNEADQGEQSEGDVIREQERGQRYVTSDEKLAKQTEQEEWSDVASDEDQVSAEQASVVSPKTLSHVDELEEASGAGNSPSLLQSNNPEHAPQSPSFGMTASSSIEHEESASSPTLLDVETHSPIQRSISAPLEDIIPPEARPKPRISDDTAILHAFLNRAAASKKPTTPIHKRESLSNRRDSDVVRLALASPAKPDILGDLDPNSPSPRKSLVHRDTKERERSEPAPVETDEAANRETEESSEAAPEDNDPESADPRPMRRSIRSRNRVVQFPPLVPSPSKYATKGPNKITIRSAATPIAIKRTEAQELSLITRTNTRKNKGGSIMPVLRLCKLAAEAASPELSPENSPTEDKSETKSGRNIRWDPTLAYYQEFADDSDQQEARRSVPAPSDDLLAGGAPEAVKAPTPMKPKARRLRTPSKAKAATGVDDASALEETPSEPSGPAESSEPLAAEIIEAPAAASKPETSGPKKRRSRIATPAKSLLTSASLLPADVASTADASANTAPAPAAIGTRKTTRSIPAPRKLTFEPATTTATAAAPALPHIPAASSTTTTTAAADTGQENRLLLTPKKSGIPSMLHHKPATSTSAMLKLDLPRPGDEAQGITSPAKRRPKSTTTRSTATTTAGSQRTQNGRDEAPPGLASPAKRRVRARVL